MHRRLWNMDRASWITGATFFEIAVYMYVYWDWSIICHYRLRTFQNFWLLIMLLFPIWRQHNVKLEIWRSWVQFWPLGGIPEFNSLATAIFNHGIKHVHFSLFFVPSFVSISLGEWSIMSLFTNTKFGQTLKPYEVSWPAFWLAL